MGSATPSQAPVISAWAAISPMGMSGEDFSAGLSAGRRPVSALDGEWPGPAGQACLVPGFTIKEVLGRKGTRSMDRATGLAVTAVRSLLGGDGGERIQGVGEDTGLVLGTSTGSAQSIMDFTRDSLVGEKPFFVDPARFPNTVMNCAAGQCAIWHRLKGPNTTIAGGRASGLLALQYALRLQKSKRVQTMLCGAVEELSPARSWLDWHSRDGEEDSEPLGEGAAVVLLESGEAAARGGRTGVAEVLGLEFGFHWEAGEIRPVLADCVRRLLQRCGVASQDVASVAYSGTAEHRGLLERLAVRDALAGHEPAAVPCAELIGDTCAASAAFQIAAVLARAEEQGTGAPGSVALVTSVDRDGVIGAALLRTA
ncbi:beta-ketoacyl synthase N-terminal-like domain-containing protein [Streptomyces sp. TS71-3]|uniref:beta-ketoacyl synthase N-terminal-like domain-containing protein n=1 Tax=Streptomyces sp. TS71-3 TaxID=2733862 RepID=UPI001B0546D0|nr:beta-ketoacyl synthase N-terminal-like domain-containing protein [Streptomyces sp. TS71-3]GHJ36849.1 3-oxoacyl-ACP synthase [Streptomyces sp. TS71-3]